MSLNLIIIKVPRIEFNRYIIELLLQLPIHHYTRLRRDLYVFGYQNSTYIVISMSLLLEELESNLSTVFSFIQIPVERSDKLHASYFCKEASHLAVHIFPVRPNTQPKNVGNRILYSQSTPLNWDKVLEAMCPN